MPTAELPGNEQIPTVSRNDYMDIGQGGRVLPFDVEHQVEEQRRSSGPRYLRITRGIRLPDEVGIIATSCRAGVCE
jgi:hypothetical protein